MNEVVTDENRRNTDKTSQHTSTEKRKREKDKQESM